MYMLHKILYGDQMKNTEMGETCSMYGRDKCIQNFGQKICQEETIQKP
jgi:hypothetical protein